MCWFMSVWTHAEVLSGGRLARLPTKGPTRFKCSWIVGLPTAGLMKDGTPWKDGIFLTFYEALLFLCVYLKGIEGFQHGALRRTRRRYLGLFCLLQTFLMNKMSGVKGFFFGGAGHHLCLKAFLLMGRIKTFWLLRWLQKKKNRLDSSCCYFGKRKKVSSNLLMGWCRVQGQEDAKGTIGEPWDDVKRRNENQKPNCGRVWRVCFVGKTPEPLDTHRKAIDCRSSAVHVIYIYYYY